MAVPPKSTANLQCASPFFWVLERAFVSWGIAAKRFFVGIGMWVTQVSDRDK